MKLVLLGAPGAGKGTLAYLLKEKFGISHISTGDILREEMKNDTQLGQEAKKYIENGELVPDEIVTQLIENKFSNDPSLNDGYLLDGYPRTRQQAEDLDSILNKVNKPLDYALFLESTLPTIIHRLTGRRVCRNCGALFHISNKPSKEDGVCDECGGELYQRADDNEETIKTRMDVYMENARPIIEYYSQKERLMKVDADKEAKEVEEHLIKKFHEAGKLNRH